MEGKSSTFFPPHSTETMKKQISQHFSGKGENHCAPVAQHWAALREVVSLIPARPTLSLGLKITLEKALPL